MPFVVDASVAAAWLLADEESRTAEEALSFLETEDALVPDLFWHEMRKHPVDRGTAETHLQRGCARLSHATHQPAAAKTIFRSYDLPENISYRPMTPLIWRSRSQRTYRLRR
ncbi:type II toxin-antitoxin system VapC family toxin [Rhizobium leguminosarum]|uniref:type II toxin-antitoxin system VapC family toxin n=1 Tax=Rhizobium leguminosarum TaxID=384 RepID=UPI0021BBE94E|nr:type II toxin-antitoxin system VapC family toxin [Rhizobium leguminosarum]